MIRRLILSLLFLGVFSPFMSWGGNMNKNGPIMGVFVTEADAAPLPSGLIVISTGGGLPFWIHRSLGYVG